MRYATLLLTAVVMLAAVGLLLTVQVQVGRVEVLTEQNGLLWEYVAVQGRLCRDLEAVYTSCSSTMGVVAGWLGVKRPEAVGGPVSREGVP